MAKTDLSEFYKLSRPKKRACQINLILTGQVSPQLSDDELKQLRDALDTDSGIISPGAISRSSPRITARLP